MNGFNTKADSKIIWVDDDYHYPEESDGTHYRFYGLEFIIDDNR